MPVDVTREQAGCKVEVRVRGCVLWDLYETEAKARAAAEEARKWLARLLAK